MKNKKIHKKKKPRREQMMISLSVGMREKMMMYPNTNWSEIARKAFNDYMDNWSYGMKTVEERLDDLEKRIKTLQRRIKV